MTLAARLKAFCIGHWQLFALTALVFALWQTPVVVPLKILVVFFHEAAHAFMAIATGGEVISIEVNARQGGVMWSAGGNRFLVSTAGYLGSLLIGVGLFLAALKSGADRAILFGLGLVLAILAALYIRDVFSLVFTLGTACIAFLVAAFLPSAVSDLLLRVIGLASMLYVPWDTAVDTIFYTGFRPPGMMSDAASIAAQVGGTEALWGAIWVAISIVVLLFVAVVALRSPSNIHLSDFRKKSSG